MLIKILKLVGENYVLTSCPNPLQVRGSGGVVGFSSANPGNKVQRVTGLSALSGRADTAGQKELNADYDPDLVGFASDVANIKARLDGGD